MYNVTIDLTEDSDDDLGPIIPTLVPHLPSSHLLEGIVDLTEDTDSLSEFIDEDTLDNVQYKLNKVQESKAKRDNAKTPTKNDIRVHKKKASKQSYDKMDKLTKERLNERKRIKQREVRAELTKNPAAKQKALDKRKEQRAKAAESTKIAKIHNAAYPSNADRLAENQREKDAILVMGKSFKQNVYIPKRVLTIASGIPFIHDPIGSTGGGGFYQKITDGSMTRLVNAFMKLMPTTEKVRYLSTLDIGSGLSGPSLLFSQYFFERGVHFGIECQAGLVHNARCNIKNVTAKGLTNIRQGLLSSSNIEKNGELEHVVPPNCIAICGDIMDIEDLAHVDVLYGFDDVNGPETFHHMAKVWNNPKSKMCKFFLTNSTEADIKDCGFEDIMWKDGVRCQLARICGHSESRVFNVFMRKTLSTRSRSKWIFENDVKVATASGPFKEAWERFHKGRLQVNTKYSFNQEIVKMNMEFQHQNGWMDNVKRSNRMPKACTYNEDKLADLHWDEATHITKGGREDAV